MGRDTVSSLIKCFDSEFGSRVVRKYDPAVNDSNLIKELLYVLRSTSEKPKIYSILFSN